jgi:carotenoid cleavage dioxygenase
LVCSSWVKTARLEHELKAGKAVLPKLGDMHGLTGLGLLAVEGAKKAVGAPSAVLESAMGTANTALEFHAGKLLALNEGDVPWHLRYLCEGALETIGACKYGNALGTSTFTAHPKLDARTGELLYFRYSIDKAPHCTYGVLDAAGVVKHTTAVPVRWGQMMHDFNVTNTFAVFWDTPLQFEPSAMVKEDKLPFHFDKAKGTRFGLLPRTGDGTTQTRWFDVEGCMIFHSLGAFDEGNTVRLFACRMDNFSLELPPSDGTQFHPRTVDGGSPTLFEWTLDLGTSTATQQCVVPLPEGCTGMDFPTKHPHLVGQRFTYGYLALFVGLEITGVAKVDVHSKRIVGRVDFPENSSAGECFFVPRVDGPPADAAAEDDGFLLTYVNTKESTACWVLDAKTMDSKPLAVITLPHRAPWGFHSLFVLKARLAAQAAVDAQAANGVAK